MLNQQKVEKDNNSNKEKACLPQTKNKVIERNPNRLT